jgi:hypothetical protein
MFPCSAHIAAVLVIFLAVGQARAQEGQPGARPPAAPGSTGPDNKYVELSRSKDRVIKATAERYLNLVKFQEWGGASGKTQMAKYVSHEPDLKRVKLSVARGSGKDRVVKEFDVDVEKLNKTCQARVKQIDLLQKRLDDLAATAAALGDGTGGPARPEVSGATAPGERGPQTPDAQGPEGGYAGPGAPPTGPGAAPSQPGAAPQTSGIEVDPSASEPDPLGFAELPPVTPGPGGAPPAGPGSLPPTSPAADGPGPVPNKAASSADRKQWRTNLASFAANISVATDPTGKARIDWGELRELGEMNDIAVAMRGPEPPTRSPEAETPAAISERLGDMHWQLVVDKVEDAPGGLVVPSFHPVDLPKPLEFRVVLDDTEDVQKWAKLPPGAMVPVSARLSISEPYKITAKVKLADAK